MVEEEARCRRKILIVKGSPRREGNSAILADQVAEGAQLAELRVMDVKYSIPSPATGRIEEVLVEDGMGVEYGQPLIRLHPGSAA